MSAQGLFGDRRILVPQTDYQLRQLLVLGIGIVFVVTTLELDSDGKIITIVTALLAGSTRMPGPIIEGDELDQVSIALDQAMRRNLEALDLGKIGMPGRIELVGEQLLDETTTIFSGRQADAVNHDQVDACVIRARFEIR